MTTYLPYIVSECGATDGDEHGSDQHVPVHSPQSDQQIIVYLSKAFAPRPPAPNVSLDPLPQSDSDALVCAVKSLVRHHQWLHMGIRCRVSKLAMAPVTAELIDRSLPHPQCSRGMGGAYQARGPLGL